jgi:hypothetical protein
MSLASPAEHRRPDDTDRQRDHANGFVTEQAHPVATHGGHIDQVNAPLRQVLHERLIQLRGMRVELRLIVGLAIAQLLVAGIMLGLKDAEGGAFTPSLYAFPAAEGNGLELISAVAFVVGVVITSVAWAYVLAGAFRAGRIVRVVILAIFGWAFFIERDALTNLGTGPTVICIAILAVILALGIATWFPESRIHRAGQAGQPVAVGRWQLARNGMVPLLFVLVGGLYLTVFLASRGFDVANPAEGVDQSQLATFSNDVFDQINNIQYLLIPLLVLAGSDFGEWGNLAVARLARRVRTSLPAWLFAVIAFAGAGGIAADGLLTASGPDGGGLLTELALAAIVVLGGVGLFFLAKPRGGWSSSVPFVAIAVVAILDTVSGFITQVLQSSSEHLNDDILLASAALWIIGGVVAVVILAMRRGRLSPGLTAGLAFVGMVGLVDLLSNIWVLGRFDNAPLGITADNAPFLGPEGIRSAVAVVTALVVIAAVATRRLRAWAVPITLLLVACVTIEVLSYIDLLYANKGKLEEISPVGGLAIGGTIILVAALLWELAVSGEAVTNIEGRHLPRDTRVLMFVGYILLVASAVLMFASLHSESGKLLESSFDAESWVKQGILFLGVPLVLTLCIAGLHRWRESDAQPHEGRGHV